MEKPSCKITLEVPFHDVDMLHVAWHGHYYKYFELARTELFRVYHFDIPVIREMGYSMVVSDSSCRYLRALKYGMVLTIEAQLVEWENRLKINYLIRDQAGHKMARGSTTHVTLDQESGRLRMVTPKDILEKWFPPAEQEA